MPAAAQDCTMASLPRHNVVRLFLVRYHSGGCRDQGELPEKHSLAISDAALARMAL